MQETPHPPSMKLLIWIRTNGFKQGQLARAASRSDAWISKRLRDHVPPTKEDRELIRAAAEQLAGKRVKLADLFPPEAA